MPLHLGGTRLSRPLRHVGLSRDTSTGPVRNPWHGMKLFVRQEKLRFPVGFCEVAGYQPGWLSSRIDKIALNSRHLLELPSLPNYDRNGCLRY
jgi:hypothetical protein